MYTAKFFVWRRSTNLNSFGLRQYWLIRTDNRETYTACTPDVLSAGTYVPAHPLGHEVTLTVDDRTGAPIGLELVEFKGQLKATALGEIRAAVKAEVR